MRECDIVAGAILATGDIRIFVDVVAAEFLELRPCRCNSRTRERTKLLHLVLVRIARELFVADAILPSYQPDTQETILAAPTIIEKCAVRTIDTIGAEIEIVTGPTTHQLVTEFATVNDTQIHRGKRAFNVDRVMTILAVSRSEDHVAILAAI